MTIDFSKTTLEYNEGFIDGLLWALKNGNKAAPNKILSTIENISKTNNEIVEEEYKRIWRTYK